MQSSLRMCPFEFSCLLSKIFLSCESNLQCKKISSVSDIAKSKGQKVNHRSSSQTYSWVTYPLLKHKIPSSPTQSITDDKLDEVKWDIENDVIQPNNASPAPSNPFNSCKSPVRIYGNQSSNLHQI